MMEYKEKYFELLEKHKRLEKEYNSLKNNNIQNEESEETSQRRVTILDEILEMVNIYFAIFTAGKDRKYYIHDLNRKAEEVESVIRHEVTGKCIDETPLAQRLKLQELLHHVDITGEAHKLAASESGDESDGYYMGFILSSGKIAVIWEPGDNQRNLADFHRQGIAFEKFADMMPEIVYEVDLLGKLTYTNHQGLQFLGCRKEDLAQGLGIDEIFPSSYEDIQKNLKSLKNRGQIISNEYIVRKRDGTEAPVATHTFAIFLNGKITGYRGVLSDISKQKEYENQIVREKAFLESLYNSAPVAIAITNRSGIVSMVNREFTNIFGYTVDEAVNRNINHLIVPEEYMEEAESLDALTSNRQREVRQTVRKDKTGRKIQVSLASNAIVINNEVVAHLAIYRDITLERKNQLLQEILYNISFAALKQMDIKEIYPTIVKELSRIWDTNNFFIALYDKSSDTLSLPFFTDEKDNFYEIPSSKTITGWVIRQNKSVLLKGDDLKMLEESEEIELVGTECKVWMGVPLKVEGNIIGVMCLQDYNDEDKFSQDDLYVLDFIANQIAIAIQRRMILDNLIQARQKAEEAAQSKQLFMSTMSHEIRTPLNEVIGITNLLLQGNPREDQMDYIKTLRFSGNHLLTLVNDVLDYNKMESGKIVFEQTQFDLDEFLQEIMRSYSFRSKAKNLTFDIRKETDLPVLVLGDPIRLNQILSNLLSNALKFTTTGSITVTVKELNRKGDKCSMEFTVTDTGIGISKDKHNLIFDSFTQASPDTTRYFGGTGLGLSICKKLIELQGGTISVESEPGVGSSFKFVIPLTVIEREGQKDAAEPPESYTGLEGKKILIAEDNKINFFVANKFLVSWGITVTHATDGLLALEMLEKEDFDLILMDLHMPVMDGIEATRIIRKSDNTKIKDIPIVALTAAIMSENHDKIDDLNINDYVLKPFKPHDLFERIKKHIR
jgi:PAS domain S-box-containing protein